MLIEYLLFARHTERTREGWRPSEQELIGETSHSKPLTCRKACQRAVGSTATRHSWQKAAQIGISWALLHKTWWSVSLILGVLRKKCSWLYKARRCCVIFSWRFTMHRNSQLKTCFSNFLECGKESLHPTFSPFFFPFSVLPCLLPSQLSPFSPSSPLPPPFFFFWQFVHRTELSCSVGRCLGSSEKHLGHPPVNQKAPLGKRSYFQKIQLPEMYCSSIAGTKCPRRNKLMTFPPQMQRPLKQ